MIVNVLKSDRITFKREEADVDPLSFVVYNEGNESAMNEFRMNGSNLINIDDLIPGEQIFSPYKYESHDALLRAMSEASNVLSATLTYTGTDAEEFFDGENNE